MKVSTGIKVVDDVTGGLALGHTLSIAGRVASGKSSLATQIAANLAKQGLVVGIIDPELSTQTISNNICKQIQGHDMSTISGSCEFAKLYPKYIKPLNVETPELKNIMDLIKRIKLDDKLALFDAIVIDNIMQTTDDSWFYMHKFKQFLYDCGLIGIITHSISRNEFAYVSGNQQYINNMSDVCINIGNDKLTVTNNMCNNQHAVVTAPYVLDKLTRNFTEVTI